MANDDARPGLVREAAKGHYSVSSRQAVRPGRLGGEVRAADRRGNSERPRSVFDRWHIVSPAALQEVARKLTATISDTVTTESAASRLTPVP